MVLSSLSSVFKQKVHHGPLYFLAGAGPASVVEEKKGPKQQNR
jgi:hypothetical protein